MEREKPVLESNKVVMLLLTRSIGQYFAYKSYRTITSFFGETELAKILIHINDTSDNI